MPTSRANSVPGYSRMPTLNYTSSRRQSALQTLGLRKKTEIEIILDGEEDWVHSYSTYDEIKGTVNLKFDKDTTIDDITVTFEGLSQTYVEKVATTAPTTGRTTGRHHFLKLLQPIEPESLPENRLAKAGVTYQIPFTFVVPDRLLPQICSHTTENGEVTRAHVQLPPSLGDASVAGDGQKLYDDLAPEMSKILYTIRARVAKRTPAGRNIEIGDKSVKIRIIPGKEEEPPIHVEEGEADYVLRKEKSVRKGLFKLGKIGRLAAETSQPRSLRLLHPSKRSTEPVATVTTVNLRFDPQDPETQPPQLVSCTTKLRSYTFFGAAPYKAIPEVSAQDNWSTLHGLYPDHVELSSRNLTTVTWTRHNPKESSAELLRRPSTFSDSSTISIPEPSASYVEGSPFWTASVLVPISLPTNCRKTFVPSFHSCIISRSYTLELNISYHPSGTTVGSPSIQLKSPIQVSSEGGIPPSQIEESEAAIAAEVHQQFFDYEARQLAEVGMTQNTNTGGSPPPHSHPAHTQNMLPPSPEYSERAVDYAALGARARHLSYAVGAGSGAEAGAAPPEYHSGAGGRVRGGMGGPARTQSEYSFIWQRGPSNRHGTTVTGGAPGRRRDSESTDAGGGRNMGRPFVMLAI